MKIILSFIILLFFKHFLCSSYLSNFSISFRSFPVFFLFQSVTIINDLCMLHFIWNWEVKCQLVFLCHLSLSLLFWTWLQTQESSQIYHFEIFPSHLYLWKWLNQTHCFSNLGDLWCSSLAEGNQDIFCKSC